MPRARHLGTDRIVRTDASTGTTLIQVTSGPLFAESLHMHYEVRTVVADGEWIIFVSRRYGLEHRTLLAARSDGSDIVQLSGDGAVSGIVPSPDGRAVYYMEDGALHRTTIPDADDEVVGRLELPGATAHRAYRGMISWNGHYYFSEISRDGGEGVVRWDVLSGEAVEVASCDSTGHPKANPGGPEVSFTMRKFLPGFDEKGKRNADKRTVYLHAETLEELDITFPRGPYGTAHSYWLGTTGKFQGTQQWPGRGVLVMERGAAEPTVIASPGPYLWHSGASYDGEWIIADTNFPYEGIWLMNVATRRSALLCRPPIPAGAVDVGAPHPHPNLSDDGRLAAFTFIVDGVAQVFVVPVPPGLREELAPP